jgi:hypothetical protein
MEGSEVCLNVCTQQPGRKGGIDQHVSGLNNSHQLLNVSSVICLNIQVVSLPFQILVNYQKVMLEILVFLFKNKHIVPMVSVNREQPPISNVPGNSSVM